MRQKERYPEARRKVDGGGGKCDEKMTEKAEHNAVGSPPWKEREPSTPAAIPCSNRIGERPKYR